MARDHDTDPNAMPGTDPNYPPLPHGERTSYGKLNYGRQPGTLRAETDPNFLTPPGGIAASSDAPFSEDPPSSNDPIESGPDSRGARSARHQSPPRRVRPGNNDTMPMDAPVVLNETVPLADALAAPEVIARRAKVMRRDQLTEVNDAGKRRKERRLISAAIWGVLAAAIVIAISEFALK